jgi:hypothetical protein
MGITTTEEAVRVLGNIRKAFVSPPECCGEAVSAINTAAAAS